MSETEEWKAELEKNAWESVFKGADEFISFLDEQDKMITELLTALDMQK